jgi:outer membrane protein OmpA-like peptidoglycan-associated protein
MRASPLHPGFTVALALAAALALGGCASEAYVDTQVAPVRATAQHALQRAEDAHRLAEGKFLYQVVLSDEAVKFPSSGDRLSSEAERRLATLASRLKRDNRNVYVEIQGFTDSRGDPRRNLMLGEARAEAARRFLSEQGVPLSRMATISYGGAHPIASNATPEGRAQNRRIVVVVLA